MKYKLRQYQSEALEAAMWHAKNYKAPFVIMIATGGGKSLVIAEMCRRLDEPTLILCPSKEILEQNYAKLKSYDIDDITMYSASVGQKEIGRYTYATIGSIVNSPGLFKHFKHVIIDEADQATGSGSQMRKFLDKIAPETLCGFTATPYRLAQTYVTDNGTVTATGSLKMMNRIKPYLWKKIAYKIETQELIDKGYLAPIKYYIDTPNTDGLVVNTTGADYTSDSMEVYARDNSSRLLEVTTGVLEKTKSKKVLVFAPSIKQAEALVHSLSDKGIKAEMVSGKTPKKERTRIVDGFRDGDIKVVVNVGVFIMGFDVPSLDCIVFGRPTMSVRVFYQAVGRGLRLDPDDPNKVLKVYDLSGCTNALGRVETLKIEKEDDGFRDMLMSEVGRLDNVPLYSFAINKGNKRSTVKL